MSKKDPIMHVGFVKKLAPIKYNPLLHAKHLSPLVVIPHGTPLEVAKELQEFIDKALEDEDSLVHEEGSYSIFMWPCEHEGASNLTMENTVQ